MNSCAFAASAAAIVPELLPATGSHEHCGREPVVRIVWLQQVIDSCWRWLLPAPHDRWIERKEAAWRKTNQHERFGQQEHVNHGLLQDTPAMRRKVQFASPWLAIHLGATDDVADARPNGGLDLGAGMDLHATSTQVPVAMDW